jgi:dienelactone hydrolase
MSRGKEPADEKIALMLLATVFLAELGEANVHTETIVYKDGDRALEGYLAYPEGAGGPPPGVLVVHDWSGPGPYSRRRAEQLAETGLVAFAVDMYGQGVRPTTTEEKARQAGIYRSDRALMRTRARAGLDVLRANPKVDPNRIAAIGYCFGGGAALELARSGAPLAGVVSFHGNLDTTNPADAKAIRAKVLVFHGAEDPYVPSEQVAAFQAEMKHAGVDYQLIAYGGAVHAFTQKEAGNDNSTGASYNEAADRRSWQAMMDFFAEVFR